MSFQIPVYWSFWSCHLPYGNSVLRFDILTVVLLKLLIPREVVSCRLVLRYQQFGEPCCPYLQGSPQYFDCLEMAVTNTNLYKVISQNTRIFSFFPIKCHWVTYESVIQDMGYCMQIFNWNKVGWLKMCEIFWCDVLWFDMWKSCMACHFTNIKSGIKTCKV